jgi:hypothetical protein
VVAVDSFEGVVDAAVSRRAVRFFFVVRFAVARFAVVRFAVLRVRFRAVVPRTVVFRAPDRFRVCFRAAFFATMSLRRLA